MTPMPFQNRKQTGRPRLVELTPAQEARLAEIYLATNRTRREGSMEAAWVFFVEETGLWPWTVKNHRLVGSLPTAAVEALRRAKGLVLPHRGGSKELRLKGPHQQGGMRMHWNEGRRLRAGESYSVDDLTRNVACWIPWPWGGCACSEAFKVKLGRWQTLVVIDDATWAAVAVMSVFRAAESYRGADAATIIFQTECEVGCASLDDDDDFRWVVEGGVWQSKQALAALGGRFHSAKGRPNQKLVERWFGAFQTLDAVRNLDLGRQRGEMLAANKLWIDCRAGRKDPRKYFAAFEAGQESLMAGIRYMNEREVRSEGLYGRWVPQERWEQDTAEHPLVKRSREDAWVALPERRTLKVSRLGMLSCTGVLADGVKRKLVWNAPWLYEHLGRKLDLYFDPMADYPVTGVVADPRTNRKLGEVVCQNPYGESRDADRERVAAIRRTMLSDLRTIQGDGLRVTEGRSPGGVMRVESNDFDRSAPDQGAGREKNHGERDAAAVPEPRQTTVAVDDFSRAGSGGEGVCAPAPGSGLERWTPGGTPDDAGGTPALPRETPALPSRSLGRRAAKAREQMPNF